MSVKKEKQFTKQALKIAIEAKLKKQMMYKKSENSANTEQKSIENKALLPKNIQYNCNTLPSI